MMEEKTNIGIDEIQNESESLLKGIENDKENKEWCCRYTTDREEKTAWKKTKTKKAWTCTGRLVRMRN